MVAPYSGDMLPSVARSAIGQELQTGSEELDELSNDPQLAEPLGDRQHEIGRRCPVGQPIDEAEADHFRDQHRDGLPEHRGLGLDPSDAPSHDAKAIDHRRVRVGADERIGIREQPPVHLFLENDAREVLEIHLVHDAGVGRNDAEVLERVLTPAQKGVSLTVPA